MKKFKTKKKEKILHFEFGSFINDPLVALSLIVLSLIALMLSVHNFMEAVNL